MLVAAKWESLESNQTRASDLTIRGALKLLAHVESDNGEETSLSVGNRQLAIVGFARAPVPQPR